MSYVQSHIDNKYYLVRNVNNKMEAANMLARIRQNVITLSDHLFSIKDKFPEQVNHIIQLHNRVNDIIIVESTGDSEYTSYSVNKGEQIVFCIRPKQTGDKLHDMNLVMYVVLHELSHVACPEFGHTELFKKIFSFITQQAILIGMYTKVDFAKDPVDYCGMMITDSVVWTKYIYCAIL